MKQPKKVAFYQKLLEVQVRGADTLLNRLSTVWLEPFLRAKSQEPTANSTVSGRRRHNLTVGGAVRLIKFPVVLLSTLSAVTGYMLVSQAFRLRLLFLVVGIFSLAAGSAAMNQFQEHHLDRLMDRTKSRPIPAGQLSPFSGLVIAAVSMAIGLLVLYKGFGIVPAVLGLGTVIFYNGIYTYLKRVTAFAAVPGAVVGALPPAVGWAAAGGPLGSPVLTGLVLFFFLWQVPHSWLLLGIHSRDYAKAGFPSLSKTFTSSQLGRMTFTWTAAAACTGMLFPWLGMFNHMVSPVFLAAATIWLGWQALPLVKKRTAPALEPVFRRTFRDINLFALAIMAILIIDHGI